VYTNDYTATISSFGNPTLRWEKTATWNLGIDYSVFGDKVFGKIDVYNKYGKDQIAQLTIPAANGTTTQKLNNAEISNRGIELEIGTQQKITNRIAWHGNLNFSYNKNRIEKLFVATYAASTLYSGGTGAYVEGANANDIWRFKYAGIQDNQPMVLGDKGTLYNFGAFTPGDGRNYLLNMGTTVAPYTLGFMNTFRVYDFDLSFILTGKFGHVFQRSGFNYPPTWNGRVLPNNKLSEVVNGDPQKIVPLPLNDVEDRYYFWDRFHQYMSYLVENASHVRMQEVNLTYNLDRAKLKKIHFQQVQLFAQANNLFTIYSNNAKEDPEYPLGTMRPQPTITLGLKASL
jgi:outer membrane receptor protein involved in Fe transport